MKAKRDEIIEILQAIHVSYTELSRISSKFKSLEIDFEGRYQSILAEKGHEKSFLDQELSYIEAIYLREKERYDTYQQKSSRSAHSHALVNISDYPMLDCEEEIPSQTLSKLFGALSLCEREHWSFVEHYLRERYPIRAKNPLELLSTRFLRFIANLPGHPPQAIAYYCDMVRRSTGSASDKEKISTQLRGVLTDVSLFLHDVITILDESCFDKNHPAYNYIHRIFEDFNLRGLTQNHKKT